MKIYRYCGVFLLTLFLSVQLCTNVSAAESVQNSIGISELSGLTEDQIEEIFSLFITNLKKLNRHHRKINMKTNRSTVRDFGSKVYYIRVRLLGISQEELSYKLNISRTSVQSYERSSEVDSVNRIISLSKLSKVSTDYLIFNDCSLQLSSYELDNERYSILKQLVQFYVKYNTIQN